MTFTPYSNTGPFTNNVVPPGISATFLNNIENFLDQIDSSVVADSNVTANGSGALTAVSLTVTGSGTGLTVNHNATITGTLTQTGAATFNGSGTGLTVAHNALVSGNFTVNGTLNLANGSLIAVAFGLIGALTNSGTTITHGLGGTPSFVGGQVSTGTGNTGAVVAYVTSLTSTTFVMSTNSVSNFPVYWIAFR